jgi:hypothetical protein
MTAKRKVAKSCYGICKNYDKKGCKKCFNLSDYEPIAGICQIPDVKTPQPEAEKSCENCGFDENDCCIKLNVDILERKSHCKNWKPKQEVKIVYYCPYFDQYDPKECENLETCNARNFGKTNPKECNQPYQLTKLSKGE